MTAFTRRSLGTLALTATAATAAQIGRASCRERV